MKKLWGGRFKKRTNPLFEAFSRSASIDTQLLYDDLVGSLAHARMLGKIGVLSKGEAARLTGALSKLIKEYIEDKLVYDEGAEDVHTFVEALLVKRVGEAAKKLHTARSRNDQVTLDTRLYCKRSILSLVRQLEQFQESIVHAAKKYEEVIIPGYTHLRHAQPVHLSHHLLAYCEMFERDKGRLFDLYRRVDVLPLGSGALAGTTIPIDREYVAKLLGFSKVSENSIDAVSDRDYVVEMLCVLSLLSMHFSRIAEELILWSTREFHFVEIDEAFCTGSSMMPQKQNPDFLELVRGETARVYGDLMGSLAMMKALPLSYNRDMQLDKTFLMDSLMRAHQISHLFPALFETLKLDQHAIECQLSDDGLLATDLAEYLVQKGVPFRKSHEAVGNLMRFLEEEDKRLSSLSISQFKKFSPAFKEDVFDLLSVESSVARKKSRGGTGTKEVKKAIAKWERKLFR